MVIKGKLITCKRESKEFKGKVSKEKLYVTLADVKLRNLATEFELPCKDIAGNEYASVEDFIKNEKFPYMGAEVKASINVKDGAVYPNSLIFLSEGKPYNPFAEFDNDDED